MAFVMPKFKVEKEDFRELADKEVIGGGASTILETGIYSCVIKDAFIQHKQSNAGKPFYTLQLEVTESSTQKNFKLSSENVYNNAFSLQDSLYLSGVDEDGTFITKSKSGNTLPLINVMNTITTKLLDKSFFIGNESIAISEGVRKLWTYDTTTGKSDQVNTDVGILSELIGQEVMCGLIKQKTFFKNKDGKFVDTFRSVLTTLSVGTIKEGRITEAGFPTRPIFSNDGNDEQAMSKWEETYRDVVLPYATKDLELKKANPIQGGNQSEVSGTANIPEMPFGDESPF